MMQLKTPAEIEIMRRGGKILARVLSMLLRSAAVGVTTAELDAMAERAIRELGGIPTFKGYSGFPSSICTSVNEAVVHGMPGKRKLRDGDLLSIDIGVTYEGFVTDSACSVGIGTVGPECARLMRVTQEALMKGIAAMEPVGATTGDVGHAVQTHAEAAGYGVVRELVGHGVGKTMHEEPQVPNFGEAGSGTPLRPGVVIAVEPMITQGRRAKDLIPEVRLLDDRWTIVAADGKLAAHFEHTVALTEEGPRILTLRDYLEPEDVARYRPKEEMTA